MRVSGPCSIPETCRCSHESSGDGKYKAGLPSNRSPAGPARAHQRGGPRCAQNAGRERSTFDVERSRDTRDTHRPSGHRDDRDFDTGLRAYLKAVGPTGHLLPTVVGENLGQHQAVEEYLAPSCRNAVWITPLVFLHPAKLKVSAVDVLDPGGQHVKRNRLRPLALEFGIAEPATTISFGAGENQKRNIRPLCTRHNDLARAERQRYNTKMQKHKRKHKKSEMRLDKDTRMAEQGFVDADTVAAVLGVSKPRAYALGTSGVIVTIPNGGAKYFSKASIDQYLRELEVPPNWITLAEAVERTGYSRSTLYQRAKTRNIQVRKLAGRVYVVTPILDITR